MEEKVNPLFGLQEFCKPAGIKPAGKPPFACQWNV